MNLSSKRIVVAIFILFMHLKETAVPLRLPQKKIGDAFVAAARTRAKFIGGARAVYDEELL